MKRADCNTDPDRARKRAVSDLRCAIRKLGNAETLRQVAELVDFDGNADRAQLRAQLLDIAANLGDA
tara:strand:- start:976 stop:1176 length:201 start_codon:yes stop_codon:yes gene_type:complete